MRTFECRTNEKPSSMCQKVHIKKIYIIVNVPFCGDILKLNVKYSLRKT